MRCFVVAGAAAAFALSNPVLAQSDDYLACAAQSLTPASRAATPLDASSAALLEREYRVLLQRQQTLRFMAAVQRALDGRLDANRQAALAKARTDFLQALCALKTQRNQLVESRRADLERFDLLLAGVRADAIDALVIEEGQNAERAARTHQSE